MEESGKPALPVTTILPEDDNQAAGTTPGTDAINLHAFCEDAASTIQGSFRGVLRRNVVLSSSHRRSSSSILKKRSSDRRIGSSSITFELEDDITITFEDDGAIVNTSCRDLRPTEEKKKVEFSGKNNLDDTTKTVSDGGEEEATPPPPPPPEEEKIDRTNLYLAACAACFCCAMILARSIWRVINYCTGKGNGDISADGVDPNLVQHGASPSGPQASGGGGGGVNGTVLQTQPMQAAVQGMTTQAASTAGSAASAGVANGAAAGVAAAGATGAAVGGAAAAAGQVGMMAAVAGSVQVITAVAVTAAVAAAVSSIVYVAGQTERLQNNNATTTTAIISNCGIEEPEFKSGRFGFVLEGINRQFQNREIRLVENIVVDAYNNVTRGLEIGTCLDKHLREMQNSTLVKQIFASGNEQQGLASTLQTTFEAWVICDGCPSDEPLFGFVDEDEFRQRLLRRLQDSDREEFEELNLSKAFLETVVEKIQIAYLEQVQTFGELPPIQDIQSAYTVNASATEGQVLFEIPIRDNEGQTKSPVDAPYLSSTPSPTDAGNAEQYGTEPSLPNQPNTPVPSNTGADLPSSSAYSSAYPSTHHTYQEAPSNPSSPPSPLQPTSIYSSAYPSTPDYPFQAYVPSYPSTPANENSVPNPVFSSSPASTDSPAYPSTSAYQSGVPNVVVPSSSGYPSRMPSSPAFPSTPTHEVNPSNPHFSSSPINPPSMHSPSFSSPQTYQPDPSSPTLPPSPGSPSSSQNPPSSPVDQPNSSNPMTLSPSPRYPSLIESTSNAAQLPSIDNPLYPSTSSSPLDLAVPSNLAPQPSPTHYPLDSTIPVFESAPSLSPKPAAEPTGATTIPTLSIHPSRTSNGVQSSPPSISSSQSNFPDRMPISIPPSSDGSIRPTVSSSLSSSPTTRTASGIPNAVPPAVSWGPTISPSTVVAPSASPSLPCGVKEPSGTFSELVKVDLLVDIGLRTPTEAEEDYLLEFESVFLPSYNRIRDEMHPNKCDGIYRQLAEVSTKRDSIQELNRLLVDSSHVVETDDTMNIENRLLQQVDPRPQLLYVSFLFTMSGPCLTGCEEDPNEMVVLVGTIPDLEASIIMNTVIGFNLVTRGIQLSSAPSLLPSILPSLQPTSPPSYSCNIEAAAGIFSEIVKVDMEVDIGLRTPEEAKEAYFLVFESTFLPSYNRVRDKMHPNKCDGIYRQLSEVSIDQNSLQEQNRRLVDSHDVVQTDKAHGDNRLLQQVDPLPQIRYVSFLFTMSGKCLGACEEDPNEMVVLVGTIPDLEATSIMDTVIGFNLLSRSTEPSGAPSFLPSIHPSLRSDLPSVLPSAAPLTSTLSSSPSKHPSASPSVSLAPSEGPSMILSSPPTIVQASDTPSGSPTREPSLLPSNVPTASPSKLPTTIPSIVPTTVPSAAPSRFPSVSPSGLPTRIPSVSPSDLPSATPSVFPSILPSGVPSTFPSNSPSQIPSEYPSEFPSEFPSAFPSGTPSTAPSTRPSSPPSSNPSASPSLKPSISPSQLPSQSPSAKPSWTPSISPSQSPSQNPSATPSSTPSNNPSQLPSQNPSAIPSTLPSSSPSVCDLDTVGLELIRGMQIGTTCRVARIADNSKFQAPCIHYGGIDFGTSASPSLDTDNKVITYSGGSTYGGCTARSALVVLNVDPLGPNSVTVTEGLCSATMIIRAQDCAGLLSLTGEPANCPVFPTQQIPNSDLTSGTENTTPGTISSVPFWTLQGDPDQLLLLPGKTVENQVSYSESLDNLRFGENCDCAGGSATTDDFPLLGFGNQYQLKFDVRARNTVDCPVYFTATWTINGRIEHTWENEPVCGFTTFSQTVTVLDTLCDVPSSFSITDTTDLNNPTVMANSWLNFANVFLVIIDAT